MHPKLIKQDHSISYFLYYVLSNINHLCQIGLIFLSQRYDEHTLKWHLQRNKHYNGPCEGSITRREYSFNSNSSCCQPLHTYVQYCKNLSNHIDLSYLYQKEAIQVAKSNASGWQVSESPQLERTRQLHKGHTGCGRGRRGCNSTLFTPF